MLGMNIIIYAHTYHCRPCPQKQVNLRLLRTGRLLVSYAIIDE